MFSHKLTSRLTALALAGAALALPVATDAGLMEVGFGVEEGRPMGDWYDSWIEGSFTPEGAASMGRKYDYLIRPSAALAKTLFIVAPSSVVSCGLTQYRAGCPATF